MLGGPTQTNKTMFGSLQLAADIRSDRDEVAPRVMSYKAPIAGNGHHARRQPLYAETQPLNVFNRIFGGGLPTGTEPQRILAQKLIVLDFMRRDLARMQTLIPASEKDRLTAHLAAVTKLEASLRQTYQSRPNTDVCVKPATPPTYANTHRPADAAPPRSTRPARASTTTSPARPTAIRTWTSASTSSA